MSRRLMIPVVAALALGACAYPDYATGSAPNYPSGYQPVMGGQAVFWPDQPGAQWGPEDVPSVDVFYEPLSQHGRWVNSRYGQVFLPNAPNGWRPYSNGQWQENRFWLSGDPWGWATDHYGRWGFDDQMGWMWVPGTQWGPSWVAWREADDVVGWAPIPPQVNWSVGIGFGSGWGYDNWNSWYGPSWVWVPRTSLYISGFGGGILPWNVGLNWWGRSRWQHSPYWGWNQPWTSSWGWQAPAYAWNSWNRPGWSNWGWNRPGWSNRNYARYNYGRPGWNGGGYNNGGYGNNWNNNRNWNRDPRRGQPGSIGDRIGRDMTGQPPQGWNGRRADRNGDGRPDGWNGNRPNGGVSGVDGRNRGNWNGNPGGGTPGVAIPNGGYQNRGNPNGGNWNGDRRGGNDRGQSGGGWNGNNQNRGQSGGGWNGNNQNRGQSGGGWGGNNQNRGQSGGGSGGRRRPTASDMAPAGSPPPVRVSNAVGRGITASVPQTYRAPPQQPAYRVSAPQPTYRAPPNAPARAPVAVERGDRGNDINVRPQ